MAVRRIIEPGHRLEAVWRTVLLGNLCWRWRCQCGHTETSPVHSQARDAHALHKHEVRAARTDSP